MTSRAAAAIFFAFVPCSGFVSPTSLRTPSVGENQKLRVCTSVVTAGAGAGPVFVCALIRQHPCLHQQKLYSWLLGSGGGCLHEVYPVSVLRCCT